MKFDDSNLKVVYDLDWDIWRVQWLISESPYHLFTHTYDHKPTFDEIAKDVEDYAKFCNLI